MKLVIVEPKPTISKKVSRIIKLTDPGIQIVAVMKDIASLKIWLKTQQAPDMVLINHSCIKNFFQQQLHARLVLPHGKTTLTYYAFRMYTILRSWNMATQLPVPASSLSPETVQLNVSHQSHEAETMANAITVKNRFMVRQGQRYFSVPAADIAYFFSDGRFVYLTTFQKAKYVVYYRMDELQELLDPDFFYRINRTYIVSHGALQQISAYFGGRFKLKLIPPVVEEVLVSKNRASGFKQWLGE